MADLPEIIASPGLAGLPHGFLTGIGHEGRPAPEMILPGSHLVTAKQVHSARAVAVEAPFSGHAQPEADALVTATKGLLLGIVTADCAPVLLADRAAGIVAAAHAGWRGALGGVLESTVALMEQMGATKASITAAIGPTIAQQSYEVDEAFHDRLVEQDAATIDLLQPGKPGHYQFDLPGFVRHRLESAGIAHVHDCALNTYADDARFHSFRRATHRAEPTYGRQFSVIGLAR